MECGWRYFQILQLLSAACLFARETPISNELLFACMRSLEDNVGWTETVYISEQGTVLNRNIRNDYIQTNWYEISTSPTEKEINKLFNFFNERKRKNIVVSCSDACLKKILTLANHYDDLADQQGYFSYTHRWLLVTTTTNVTHLVDHIGILNNVLIITQSEIQEKQSIILYTAIGQNKAPQLQKFGTCNGGQISNNSILYPNADYGLNRRHLVVSTNVWTPFVGKTTYLFSTYYHGLCLDMLETISELLNFTYSLREPLDGKWGTVEDGKWTGLVSDLVEHRADMVVAPIVRMGIRERVMDFASQPFYQETFTGLYKSPGLQDRSWQLLLPFRWEVWVLLVSCIPLTSFVIFSLNKMTSRKVKSDWGDCVLNTQRASFSQSAPTTPLHTHSRSFWICWWFFCIVISTLYSANLIAYLATMKPTTPFKTFPELLEISTPMYTYGTLGGTANTDYFRNSKAYPYTGMWEKMVIFNQEDSDIFSPNHRVHVNKVKRGGYVYIADMTSIQLSMADDCTLAKMQQDLETHYHYSIGLRNNSAFGQLVGDITLRMHSSGLLEAWKNKHWPQPSINCSAYYKPAQPSAGLTELYGTFLLLCFGIAIATIVFLVEMVGFAWRRARGACHTLSPRSSSHSISRPQPAITYSSAARAPLPAPPLSSAKVLISLLSRPYLSPISSRPVQSISPSSPLTSISSTRSSRLLKA